MDKPPPNKPEVRVKPHFYQPTAKELNAPVKINATPERLAEIALRQVRVVKDGGA